MAKIKKWYRSIPIWLALFFIIIIALLISAVVSNKVISIVNELWFEVQAKYITVNYDITQGNNDVIYNSDVVNEVIEYNFNYEQYSEDDILLYRFCTFIQRYFPAFVYSVSIGIAIFLFYFTKLKKPLVLLSNASDRIAENNLNFTLDYCGTDEMAKLCAAFEKMRVALDENNQYMFRIIDERKQLNDAYSHDLRTPIAVLKGYTDMLIKYAPSGQMPQKEVLETVKTMSVHISRLEKFVDSMNAVQKLEDMTIHKEPCNTDDFVGHLQESAAILCQTNSLACEFESEIKNASLQLDANIITQVYENLMNNAIRFAQSKIMIKCTFERNYFIISIADDGEGFSEKELLKADKPYYRGSEQEHEFHFGLGLHICRTLCQMHGGKLELKNGLQGGAIVNAYFHAC